jgi:RimJ/RimL family protein N-acetyltransferase
MNIPQAFHTQRLVLRVPVQTDAEDIFRVYSQDREVTRFLSWAPITKFQDVQLGTAQRIERHLAGVELSWAITSASSGELMGMITVKPRGPLLECGFALGRMYWNNGYMTEALTTLVSWAMVQPRLLRFCACCDVENDACVRVLEKAGFIRTGVLRRWAVSTGIGPEPRDCFYYLKILGK